SPDPPGSAGPRGRSAPAVPGRAPCRSSSCPSRPLGHMSLSAPRTRPSLVGRDGLRRSRLPPRLGLRRRIAGVPHAAPQGAPPRRMLRVLAVLARRLRIALARVVVTVDHDVADLSRPHPAEPLPGLGFDIRRVLPAL